MVGAFIPWVFANAAFFFLFFFFFFFFFEREFTSTLPATIDYTCTYHPKSCLGQYTLNQTLWV